MAFINIPTLAYGEEQHGDEAITEVNKAEDSAKSGDVKASTASAEKAKKHLLKKDSAHPYPKSVKKITGENPKQEHDEAAVSEINKAEGHLKAGETTEAAEHEKEAETHVKQLDQTK